jgi:putative ATPase
VGADDLFTAAGDELARAHAPLAARMRPRRLDEVVGQAHLLVAGSPLRRLVEDDGGPAGTSSVILWGPPGSGKTTLAHLVSSVAGRGFLW